MAPKKPAPSPRKASTPATHPSAHKPPRQSTQQALRTIRSNYQAHTPARTKLLDAFLLFLMAVGALQMLYCVLAGNYPFNAFLAGFSATVGQFVLTASLRMQTDAGNKREFAAISHERAFADFVFGSLVLHFFCVNFIN